jgi:NTE family protein
MKYQLRSLLALVLVCITSTFGVGQNAPTAATGQRPKIGLVLQGGGALGLAHVGVITWLKRRHIPVAWSQKEIGIHGHQMVSSR